MSHHISGIIFKKDLHTKSWDGICHVNLPQGYVLVTDEGGIAEQYDPSCKWSSDRLMDDIEEWRVLVRQVLAKHLKTYASIWTDYFGGMGEQGGKAWVDGTRVVSGDSINDALVAIGVVKNDDMDEFDTINLGRYRDADDISSEWKESVGIKEGLEIEKRFLLRRIPTHTALPKNVEEMTEDNKGLIVTQLYVGDDADRFRVRRIIDRSKADNITEAVKYVLTRKQHIAPGIHNENEHPITMAEFAKHTQDAHKQISKVRYEVPCELNEGLVWEIDIFEHLIIAEIEIPSEDWEVRIPAWLQKVIIMEVTDFKQFTNYSLAEPIK